MQTEVVRSVLPSVLILLSIFCGALLAYFLNQWMPTLLVRSGLSQHGASISGSLLNIGAIAAVICCGLLMDRFGAAKVTIAGYALAVPLLLLLGQMQRLGGAVGLVLFLAGMATIGSQVGPSALVATHYPARLQLTMGSIGYITSRLGAVIGPILAGYLLEVGLSITQLFYVMALPALCVIICMYSFRNMQLRPGIIPEGSHRQS